MVQLRKLRNGPGRVSAAIQKDANHGEIFRSDLAGTHIYCGLWSVFSDFGGMTRAVILRLNSLLRLGDIKSATILTFAGNNDADSIRAQLLDMDILDERIVIRNLWSEIREWGDRELQMLEGKAVDESVGAAEGVRNELSDHYVVYRDPDSKGIVRHEHYRPDGSLLLIDTKSEGSRRLVLYGPDEVPIVEWSRARDLYLQWTRKVITKKPAVFIVDAGPVSVFAHEMKRRDFTMVHYLHVSQLKRPELGRNGELVSNRLESFRNFDSYDFTAVQSQQQIDDLAARGFDRNRMKLLPSEISQNAFCTPDEGMRDEFKACVVARLVDLKQIDHAIRAVALAHKRIPQLRLEIYGKGKARARLEKLVGELGLEDVVSFQGHVPDLPARLAESSFSLLTSKFEGLPLAIRESMAAGCVPITYDITYGPRDIISHGINGYVVPHGNINDLGDQIVEFVSLEAAERRSMREAAVSRAKDFLPEQLFPAWKQALETPRPMFCPSPFVDSKYIRARRILIESMGSEVDLSIEFDEAEQMNEPSLQMVVTSRKKNTFFQAEASPRRRHLLSRSLVYSFSIDSGLFSDSSGQTFDIFVRTPNMDWDSKVRVKTPESFEAAKAVSMNWYRTEFGNFSVSIAPKQETKT